MRITYQLCDRFPSELAPGMFANDALPEEKAKELQAVVVNIETAIAV